MAGDVEIVGGVGVEVVADLSKIATQVAGAMPQAATAGASLGKAIADGVDRGLTPAIGRLKERLGVMRSLGGDIANALGAGMAKQGAAAFAKPIAGAGGLFGGLVKQGAGAFAQPVSAGAGLFSGLIRQGASDLFGPMLRGARDLHTPLTEGLRIVGGAASDIGVVLAAGIQKGVEATKPVVDAVLGIGKAGATAAVATAVAFADVGVSIGKVIAQGVIGAVGMTIRAGVKVGGWLTSSIATLVKGALLPTNMLLAGGGVGIAAAFGIGNMVNQAAEFKDAMIKATAQMPGAAEMQTELTNEARRMSRTMGVDVLEIARAYEQMAEHGWNARDAVAGLGTMMQFTRAAGGDLGSNIEKLSVAVTRFGLDTSTAEARMRNMQFVGNAMAAAAKAAGTTVGRVSELVTGGISEVAGRHKWDVKDVAAAAAALQAAGKAPLAGELEGVLRQIEAQAARPTSILRGIVPMYSEATGELKGPIALLEAFQSRLQGMSKPQQITALEQWGLRGGTAVRIQEFIEALDKIREVRAGMGDVRGALDMIADAMAGRYSTAVNKFKAVLADLSRTIGEPLAAGAGKVVTFLVDVADQVRAAVDRFMPTIKERFAAISDSVVTIFRNLFNKGKEAADASGIGAVITKIVDKITEWGVKIADIAATLSTNLGATWDLFKKSAEFSFAWVKLKIVEVGNELWDILANPKTGSAVGEFVNSLWKGLQDIGKWLGEMLANAVQMAGRMAITVVRLLEKNILSPEVAQKAIELAAAARAKIAPKEAAFRAAEEEEARAREAAKGKPELSVEAERAERERVNAARELNDARREARDAYVAGMLEAEASQSPETKAKWDAALSAATMGISDAIKIYERTAGTKEENDLRFYEQQFESLTRGTATPAVPGLTFGGAASGAPSPLAGRQRELTEQYAAIKRQRDEAEERLRSLGKGGASKNEYVGQWEEGKRVPGGEGMGGPVTAGRTTSMGFIEFYKSIQQGILRSDVQGDIKRGVEGIKDNTGGMLAIMEGRKPTPAVTKENSVFVSE